MNKSSINETSGVGQSENDLRAHRVHDKQKQPLAYVNRLWWPETHDGIDAAGGEQTRGGVGLYTVDNVFVRVEHFDEVGAPAVPDEQIAVVRAGRDVLRARVGAQSPLPATPPPVPVLELAPPRNRSHIANLQVAHEVGLRWQNTCALTSGFTPSILVLWTLSIFTCRKSLTF